MQENVPNHYTIDPAVRLGPVTLTISDRATQLRFYRDVLGFRLLDENEEQVTLGAGTQPLLVLRQMPGAQPRPPRTTGLYHIAILLPDRVSLAQLLSHLLQTGFPIGGASDHGVSEALYMNDAEGNGLELYRDRPRAEWPRQGDELRMVTEPLQGLFDELRGQPEIWTGLPAGTTVGHIHLQVSRLDDAVVFYRDVLGFDLMQRYGPSAAFMSAGGYHHHIGMNTWAGVGAPRPPANAVGLDHYSIILPNRAALEQTIAHVQATGTPVHEQEGRTQLEDPSGNRIALMTEE